jgi:hypothetical protein
MSVDVPRAPQPLRRDLVDPRSCGAPAVRGGKPLLNDIRSTRRLRGRGVG